MQGEGQGEVQNLFIKVRLRVRGRSWFFDLGFLLLIVKLKTLLCMKTCLQTLDYAFQIPLQKLKIYLVKLELSV